MRLTAMRHMTQAKATRKAKRARSTASKPKAPPRTSSTSWCRGLSWATTCEPLGQAVDREEGAGDEEERRDEERGDVVELVDLGDGRRHRDAEAGEAERGDEAEERHEQHPPGRVEAEGDRDQQRDAAVDAGAERRSRASRR